MAKQKIDLESLDPNEIDDYVNEVIEADEILKAANRQCKKLDKEINKEEEKEETKINIKDIINSFHQFMEKEAFMLAKMGKPSKNKSLNDSYLRLNYKYKYYKIHNDTFRRRFLIFFFDHLDRRIKRILDVNYLRMMNKKQMDSAERMSPEYAEISKRVIMMITDDVIKLSNNMLNDQDFYEPLVWLSFDISGYARLDVEGLAFSKKRKGTMIGIIRYLKDATQTNLFGETAEYMDVLLFKVFNSAFVYAVDSYDEDALAELPDFENLDKKETIGYDSEIIELGKCICDEIEEMGHSFTPIIMAFESAMPLIYTGIKGVNEFIWLNIGVLSLNLLAFLCNDRNVYKFIEKITS